MGLVVQCSSTSGFQMMAIYRSKAMNDFSSFIVVSIHCFILDEVFKPGSASSCAALLFVSSTIGSRISVVKNDSKYSKGSAGSSSVMFSHAFPVKSRRCILLTGADDHVMSSTTLTIIVASLSLSLPVGLPVSSSSLSLLLSFVELSSSKSEYESISRSLNKRTTSLLVYRHFLHAMIDNTRMKGNQCTWRKTA